MLHFWLARVNGLALCHWLNQLLQHPISHHSPPAEHEEQRPHTYHISERGGGIHLETCMCGSHKKKTWSLACQTWMWWHCMTARKLHALWEGHKSSFTQLWGETILHWPQTEGDWTERLNTGSQHMPRDIIRCPQKNHKETYFIAPPPPPPQKKIHERCPVIIFNKGHASLSVYYVKVEINPCSLYTARRKKKNSMQKKTHAETDPLSHIKQSKEQEAWGIIHERQNSPGHRLPTGHCLGCVSVSHTTHWQQQEHQGYIKLLLYKLHSYVWTT